MEKRLMFTRKFTSILKLQEEHEYRYYFLWDEKTGQYGIQVTEAYKEKICGSEEFYFTFDREMASSVLLYLYENCISSSLIQDILRDFKVNGCI